MSRPCIKSRRGEMQAVALVFRLGGRKSFCTYRVALRVSTLGRWPWWVQWHGSCKRLVVAEWYSGALYIGLIVEDLFGPSHQIMRIAAAPLADALLCTAHDLSPFLYFCFIIIDYALQLDTGFALTLLQGAMYMKNRRRQPALATCYRPSVNGPSGRFASLKFTPMLCRTCSHFAHHGGIHTRPIWSSKIHGIAAKKPGVL